MKVLFLDIDGVLNSTRSAVAFSGYPHSLMPDQLEMFDHVALALVRRITSQGVSVVMSTSWRYHFNAVEFAHALKLPVFDVITPILRGPRGKGIAAWLKVRDDVSHWAIVDDDSDMLPEQMPRFVKTDLTVGMSLKNYEELCRILEIKA
jgi:hypothetical protein